MNPTYFDQLWNYFTSVRVQTTLGCIALIVGAPYLGLTPDQMADVRNVLIALIIGSSLRPPGTSTPAAPNTRGLY